MLNKHEPFDYASSLITRSSI